MNDKSIAQKKTDICNRIMALNDKQFNRLVTILTTTEQGAAQ